MTRGLLRGGFAALLCVLLSFITNAPADAAPATPFRHVVIVIQENRTPDNLFGAFRAQVPGADLAASGVTSKGQTVPLTPVPLGHTYDLDHKHQAFVEMYDQGRMDGADLVQCYAATLQQLCPAFPQFRYVNGADVAPYFAMARDYGFANRMFQTNQGPSYPAHQFLLSGTSQLSATSVLFASENMMNTDEPIGCAAPPDQRVEVIGPGGAEEGWVFPCFEHQTLPDLLDRHRPPIPWRYYAPSAGSIWTAPNSIRHLCRPSDGNCAAPIWSNGTIELRPPQVLLDIARRKLEPVSWVIPDGHYSDHASYDQDGTGPSWVAAIINAIGQSSYWSNTAIIVTWDDWGGWYDHVAPPPSAGRPFGYYELGFRVPLLVVSAWTPRGYISNTQHDFGSVLHFVEKMFSLGLIPPGDFADARADDLADFFDFHAAARKFVPIPAPLPGRYFIDDTRSPTPPDSD